MEASPALPRFASNLLAALGTLALAAVLTAQAGLTQTLTQTWATQPRAEPVRATIHSSGERKTFTDGEIIQGFMKTAFGAEYHLAGRVDRIRKYHAPVRIFIDGANRADRRSQLGRVVSDIAAKIRHLDIAMTPTRDSANAVITLVHDRDLNKTIADFYGSDRAREIHKVLDPQCLSGFRKDENFEIQRSDVILTVDNGDFVFLDCAYEELLQSLGPINDTDAVPWTMFNDQVSMGFFDIYDQYIMNILYDPRIRAGMTVDEVRAVLPQVMPDVRAWVAKVNDLPL